MKIIPKNQKTRKFQVGGLMEAPMEEAPMEQDPVEQASAEQELQDPMMMLALMSALALLNQDCLMAMLVCQAFLEILQQMQGGAPEEPQGEPVFRKGGILVRRIKKS